MLKLVRFTARIKSFGISRLTRATFFYPLVFLMYIGSCVFPVAAAEGCEEEVRDSAISRVILSADSTYSTVRQKAVRQALLQIVEQVSGVQIATSFDMIDREADGTLTSESKHKTRIRSAGNVNRWEVVKEEIITQEDEKLLKVLIEASICKKPSVERRPIIAFKQVELPADISMTGLRELLSVGASDEIGYEISLLPANEAYYDILVSGEVLSAELVKIDNTSKIEKLSGLVSNNILNRIPPQEQRVLVRVMTKAEFLNGANAIVQRVDSSQTLADGSDLAHAKKGLIEAALRESMDMVYKRLAKRFQNSGITASN